MDAVAPGVEPPKAKNQAAIALGKLGGLGAVRAERLAYSVAITLFYHNFVRIHPTLRMPPAMKAGITTHKWSIDEMVDLLRLIVPGKRGSYKKRRQKISD